MKIEQNNSLISVYGVGNIKIQPNIIIIKVYLSQVSKTLKEAQLEVNKNVNKLLKLFEELKIENIQTSLIKFNPEYEWEGHKKKYIGQKVEQGFVITINDLNNNLQKSKDFLDIITTNIEILECSVNFGIDNYEEEITKARNIAYNNAFEKAKQYAKLANLDIIKTLKISEFEPRNDDYEYDRRDNIMMCGSTVGSTEILVDEIDIETKLFCDFLAQ
jgi:uncharacterized protein YggE